MTDAERLDTLEFKVAHLERAQQELSDALVHQQRELARLREDCARLGEMVAALQQPAPAGGVEIPPHY